MQKLCATESCFSFLILNGFAGVFLIIFFNFMQTFEPSNEWSLLQSAPRKTGTFWIGNHQLLLIQI